MIHVAAPLRVRERLSAAADGRRRIIHAGPAAIYVDLDGWCLGLVSATATRVPCALWTSLPDLTHLAAGSVLVDGGTLVVSDEEVRVTRLADPRLTLVPPDRPSAPSSAPSSAPRHPSLRSISDIRLPVDGRLTPADAGRLLGRGPGLTPLGDDILAGWFATRQALGQPDALLEAVVRRRLGVTTLLSATLLDCAFHGEALPQLADWLDDPTPLATEALLAVGATSGAGLLTGAELALTSFAHHTQSPGRAA